MKKILCGILSAAMICSAGATATFASDFKDMPDNWSTQALEKAVDNGLLSGYDGYIRPTDNLTRAEMATIMVRAFDASREDDISEFEDVDAKAWYYENMAKAVSMGLFKGDGKNLNPLNDITRQEAFAVLARAFDMKEGDESDLKNFTDKDKVSSWAVPSVAAIVLGGYASGDDQGRLNPTNSITRAEFAVLMNNIVSQYITKSGTYGANDISEGNILIRANNVTIKEATVKGDIILGENIKTGGVTLDSTTVNGSIINDDDGTKVITKSTSSETVIIGGNSRPKPDNPDTPSNPDEPNPDNPGAGDDGSGTGDDGSGIEDGGEI